MTVVTRLTARTPSTSRPSAVLPETAEGWNRVAAQRLARGRWREADEAARQGLGIDPRDLDAWTNLAAAFAGPGWFDQADQCLSEARRLAGDAPVDDDVVGRAVNQWALAPTAASSLTLVALVLTLGLLGLAVALSLPFLHRELRIRRLPPAWRARAERAWVHQRSVRRRGALAVATTVSVWALAVALAA